MQLFSLLRSNKSYALFFVADFISCLGSGMSLIGLNWYIYKITQSSSAVGQLMVVGLLSTLLASPAAAGICDRYSRRLILLATNLFRGANLLIILVLTIDIDLPAWCIFMAAFVNGIGIAFYTPASRAFVQEILDNNDFFRAGNSLLEISLQVGMLMSAGVTGFIYNAWGVKAIFLIDGATFIASFALLFLIGHIETVTQNVDNNGFINQITSGYNYLSNAWRLMILGLLGFIPLVVTISSNVVLPGYISDILYADAIAFGISDMCYGAGACCAGFISGFFMVDKNQKTSLFVAFMTSGIVLTNLSINKSIAGLYMCFVVFGVCNSLIKILINTILMQLVPPNIFGRAMAFWTFSGTLFQILITVTLGAVIDRFSPEWGYVILAAIMFITLIPFMELLKSRTSSQGL